ncbi:Lrp/AsnC ligand binding domain-containing protein [Falsiroseomonas selenitidurans]|uniref:Winged helix-turn-helix transcriptional regulator n=1 Tax=Falsiroseomonas selenitidurans TaxID=2716335 RepID=A0ABX1E052_9PROT|nr:Lrp/AsnC ligand binding domain-containing protein [Falsiroseomonas selenitidurans]NKC30524.1 winged helix-turn-helix transcriptional regulator [Falsiroseomonas selenitidurans]
MDHDIDRIDRRLLALLQREGRATVAEMAAQVGLSPSAASERLRRLQSMGIITGWGARLDAARIGLGLLVFVEISLDHTTPDAFDRFATAVKRVPAVLECHMVAGGFDYLVKARVADMAAYRRFLGEVLLSLPGVKASHTYAVIEEVIAEAPLPV